MDPEGTKYMRASIVARARFIEDLVMEELGHGVGQYVILGAGLDTFSIRRQEMAARLKIFEIDQPATLAWKKQRMIDLGFGIPAPLRFVPVDFETGPSWWEELNRAGFDAGQPAVVACTGVTLYLTREAILAALRQIAGFAPGSKLAMTFILPPDLLAAEEKPMLKKAEKGARSAGTPFISFFSPGDMLALAGQAGLKDVKIVSGHDLARRYFSGRTDSLSPSNGEQFLVAAT
jgi:methyltransferase (TIGR00027 family)